MRYLGGKSRIAKQIAAYLKSVRQPGQLYIEPFCGACWVLQEMENPRQASDVVEDLILLWQALQTDWQPPTQVSEDEYKALRGAAPSALRGFVGFGCSFGGKWFGGYARHYPVSNYAATSARSVNKQRKLLTGVNFCHQSYATLDPIDALIYCDPPYADTTHYGAAKGFDSVVFWRVVRGWSQHNIVIVSEYKAPDDFECVLEIPTKLSLREANGCAPRTERLFRWKG